MSDVWPYILQGYVLLVIFQMILWIIQVRTHDASTADVGWSIGMLVLVGYIAWRVEGFWLRELLVVGMVAVWSVRLSVYLLSRLAQHKEEDSRYARLRDYWGEGAEQKFIIVFQLQPIFNVVLSIPLVIALRNPQEFIGTWEAVAFGVWICGIIGESVADHQLNRFRNNPINKGKICSEGLWHYSRHPNFFFEWTMWVAYALFAFSSPNGVFGLIAPVFMLFLLMKVTGIPVMEKHALKKKGAAFKEYMQNTSFFVPMPRKVWQQLSRG